MTKEFIPSPEAIHAYQKFLSDKEGAEITPIDYIQFIFIDLFCGAGGTTIGVEKAEHSFEDKYAFLKSIGVKTDKDTTFKMCKVVACVNHDPIAIQSHWANHSWVEHFEEDIRILDPYGRLKRLIEMYRAFYPHAKIILWGSLECTNFSKAKGGEGRDQDSRTLALELYHYIHALDPDYIMIENVVEFMGWGPMFAKEHKTHDGYAYCKLKIKNKDGKLSVVAGMVPESKNNGKDWLKWRATINSFGYHDAWKQINSADFGALTSRNRLFGCFAKDGLPIIWPIPTHSKKPDKTSMVQPLKKWQAVKLALDFEDEGNSIFNRLKRIPNIKCNGQGYAYCKLSKYDVHHKTFGPIPDDLVPATMQRLFMGSVKHIAGGKENFLMKYYSGKPQHKNSSIDDPSPSITTFGGGALVKADRFIAKHFSGKPEDKSSSVEDPLSTITTKDHNAVVKASFINQRNGGKPESKNTSIEEPARVLTTSGGNLNLVQASFISRYNGVNGGKHDNSHSVEGPVGALATGDNHSKVTAKFLTKYNGNNKDSGGNSGKSIEEPAPTLSTENIPGIVSAHFIAKQYSQGGQHNSIEEPAATLTTKDRLSKISAEFIDQQFTQGKKNQSVEEPLGALTTVPKSNLVKVKFMDKQFSGDDNHQSVEQPAGSILPNDKHVLISADKFIAGMQYRSIKEKTGDHTHSIEDPFPTITASRHHHYIINPSWFNESARSVDEPCYVVVARQDKAPLYLITCTEGPVAVPVYEGDCEWTIKLKEFMALYNICDIKMRMLKIPELKKIQGFPEDYILLGTQTDQKKFIGNAVVPLIPQHWIQAFSRRLTQPTDNQQILFDAAA